MADIERELERLRAARPNFEPGPPELFTPELGWHRDDVRQQLPPGSWEEARRLMHGYEFADPSVVRAHYDPDEPLDGRTMLLEVRFYGLRFHVGTRVNRVYERAEGGARVWGWSYQTLEGHFEMGEMSWEVREDRDSGEVSFRIHSFSRAAPLRNPFVRIGFKLFGRREQLRFLASTCGRMALLTRAALAGGPQAVAEASQASMAKREPDPTAGERLAARAAPGDAAERGPSP